MQRYWIMLLGFLWGIGCESDIQGRKFPSACWHQDSTVVWPVGKDLSQIDVRIAFSQDFPYRNFIMQVAWETKAGKREDTLVRVNLVDSLGYWLLEPRGGAYEWIFSPGNEIAPDIGSEVFFQQYMRDSLLCGVDYIGFRSRRGER